MKSLAELIEERQAIEEELSSAGTLEQWNQLRSDLKRVQTMIDTWGTHSQAVFRIV